MEQHIHSPSHHGSDKGHSPCGHYVCLAHARSPALASSPSPFKPMMAALFHCCWCLVLGCSVVSNSLGPYGSWPPGSSVRGMFQARILAWVTISYSRGSFQPRDHTCFLYLLHWQVDSLPLSHLGSPLLPGHFTISCWFSYLCPLHIVCSLKTL